MEGAARLSVPLTVDAEGIPGRLVMQVHDELVLEVRREAADAAARVLREEMEGAARLSVPLTVDVTISDTWLE